MVNWIAEQRHPHSRRRCATGASRVKGASCVAGVICAVFLFHGAQAQTDNAENPNFAPTPYTNWDSPLRYGDRFLPPESGPGPVEQSPDYPYILNALGDDTASDPTYRVSDLGNPILTPWAIERMQYWNDIATSGDKAPFRARSRCYPPGGAAWVIFRNGGQTAMMQYFAQLPDQVLMMWRGDNWVRRVYLNVPHSENLEPSWFGESVGHYEGDDTLVVDTIGFIQHDLSFVDNYRTPHSDKLHVVERFVLVDANTMMVYVHVEDPIAFTSPWKGVVPLVANNRAPIAESICGELGLTPGDASFGYFTVPILQAESADF